MTIHIFILQQNPADRIRIRWYRLKNIIRGIYGVTSRGKILLMSACPYKVGDIIDDVIAVEILIPSGFYTTEMDRI